MEWLGAATDTFAAVASEERTGSYILLPSQVAAFTDVTLIRCRGHITLRGENTLGIIGDAAGAAGIIRWNDREDTAPIASELPDPFVDTDHDWVWHTFFYKVGGYNLGSGMDLQIEIDSKAMRRLGNDTGLLMVIRNAVTGDELTYGWGVRCLLKE